METKHERSWKGERKERHRKKEANSVETILFFSVAGFRIPVLVIRDGGFVIGRKKLICVFVIEFGVESFCHNVSNVVFRFDVEDFEDGWVSIWISDLISDVMVLDVHELRTLESHFLSTGDMDGGLIVAMDVSHGDGKSELFGKLGEPTELLGCVEQSDVF